MYTSMESPVCVTLFALGIHSLYCYLALKIKSLYVQIWYFYINDLEGNGYLRKTSVWPLWYKESSIHHISCCTKPLSLCDVLRILMVKCALARDICLACLKCLTAKCALVISLLMWHISSVIWVFNCISACARQIHMQKENTHHILKFYTSKTCTC